MRDEQQLDAAAIHAVAELAASNARHEIQTFRAPGDPDDVSFRYDTRTGEVQERYIAEPGPLGYVGCDTRAVVEFVTADGYERQAIYYTLRQITGVRYHQATGRREMIELTLPLQAPFAHLSTCAGTFVPHRKFWTLLRTMFCAALPAETIARFKNVTFGTGGQVVSDRTHGRESVAQSVSQRVQTEAGDLPEVLVFTVGAYDLEEVRQRDRYNVAVAVEVDASQQAFALIPMAGELERTFDEALAALVRNIREALTTDTFTGPIICGKVKE